MRKVALAMFISLDGFIEGPNQELVAPAYSADLERYWIKGNVEDAGLMMYGRVCYEGMAQFWTSPAAPQEEARQLAEVPKIVFSRSLQKANWKNTTIVHDDIADTVVKLKLIDEYRLLVSPIVLGAGTPLFQGGYARFNLTLADAKPFDNGAILLT